MLDNYRDKSVPIGYRSRDPHIFELDDMFQFCMDHSSIYICGTGYEEKMLYKLLKGSPSIPIKGFATWEEGCADPARDVYFITDVVAKEHVGIILGMRDELYRKVIPMFRKIGFTDYFLPTEWNKHSIAERMTPRDPGYNSFEVSLVDHCNMSCQMCDHYSQLSEEWFISPETLEKDLKRMHDLCDGQCAVITLLGGEPLLHPELLRCMEIARNAFPECPLVLLTNGVLLLELEKGKKGNIWEKVKELNITISITRYPISLDYEAIRDKADEYGVNLMLSSDIHSEIPLEEAKISYKHTLSMEKDDDTIFFPACHYYNHLGVVREGRYYMCPVSAHIDIFNKRFGTDFELAERDSVDIYKIKNWEEIAYFQADRIPFCSYCNIRKWGTHSVWKPSSRNIEEYT